MDLQIFNDTPPWDWPKDAGKMFLDVLRDDRADESNRLLAAEMAGNTIVISDEMVDALLSIVRSGGQSEKLRGTAAIALGPVLEQTDLDGFEDLDDALITEGTFHQIKESLKRLYMDAGVPKQVRRRILEASVRAQQDWHHDAIRAAYSSPDEDWKLTAVFCMRWVHGFDGQILEALNSANPEIHYEAVRAAGNWEVDAAWPHLAALVTSKSTAKPLLLAAIGAVASIRPEEAGIILVDLTDALDEEIVEAAYEAMAIASGSSDDEDEDEEQEQDGSSNGHYAS